MANNSDDTYSLGGAQHVLEPMPESIQHIRILGTLGEGGMGTLYLGFDEKLKRKVAVKTLRIDQGIGEQSRSRFKREAEILSALEHPNICRVYELIHHGGVDYLVLELIHGRRLDEAKKGGMSFNEKLSVSRQIAEVLATAHGHGIVHRDLKPGNVMVTPSGDAKVLDFGIAHSLTCDTTEKLPAGAMPELVNVFEKKPHSADLISASFRTEYGIVSGTPAFMSPEQARCEPTTAASDMFSFGLLLQWLFSDTAPYDSDLQNHSVLFKAMLGKTRPVKGLAPDLTKLIDRLKALAPEIRPTAVEAGDVLQQIAGKSKRRIKRLVALAFVVTLAIGTVVASLGFYRARQAQAEAEAVNSFLVDMLKSANPYEIDKDVKVADTLDAASEALDSKFSQQPKVRAAVAHVLGVTYSALGKNTESRALLEKAFEIRKKSLGAKDARTLATMVHLGHTLVSLGRHDEADPICSKAYELTQEALGPDHKVAFTASYVLARLRSHQGRIVESVDLYLKAIEKSKKLYGERHFETRGLKGDLAMVYIQQGSFRKAEALCRQQLDMERTLQDEREKSTHMLTYYLGSALKAQGKYDEAKHFLTQSLDIHMRKLGHDHLETMETKRMLAAVEMYQGDYERAGKAFKTLADKSIELFGAEHYLTLSCLNGLGSTLFLNGEHEEAETVLRQLLDSSSRVYGIDHPDTLMALNNLSNTLAVQGKNAEALTLMRKSLELKRKRYGEDHINTASAAGNLGVFLSTEGEHEEAEGLLRKALELNRQYYGEANPNTVNIMAALARDLFWQNRIEESIALFRQALHLAEQVFVKDHPKKLSLMTHFANTLLAIGERQEAVVLLSQAAELGNEDARIELEGIGDQE